MEAAQVLASYSLGDADNLRRAMGKKKADVMEEEKAHLLQDAKITTSRRTRPLKSLIILRSLLGMASINLILLLMHLLPIKRPI